MTSSHIMITVLGANLASMPIAIVVSRLLIRGQLRTFFDTFPSRPELPDVVRREFRSFSIGIINLGFSVHAAADHEHLHMNPAQFVRLCRMRPMSIPWSELKLTVGKNSGGERRATIHADKHSWTLRGPRWCLELIEPTCAISHKET